MSEHCKYADSLGLGRCPVRASPFIVELAKNPCDNIEGGNEICGPIAAYVSLAGYAEELKELDASHPIIGKIRVTNIPTSSAVDPVTFWPAELELPLRSPETMNSGTIEISSVDMIHSLMANGQFEEADSFIQADARQPFTMGIILKPNDISVVEHEPVGSWEYYSTGLMPGVREAIDIAVRAARN